MQDETNQPDTFTVHPGTRLHTGDPDPLLKHPIAGPNQRIKVGGERVKRAAVYAVTSGEYSDYTVDCLFTRREDAERYVAARMGERVEEMDLYSEMPDIFIEYSATILKQTMHGRPEGDLNEYSERTLERPRHKVSDHGWGFTAEGPDRERVIKSVRDRYTKWKAEQEGVA